MAYEEIIAKSVKSEYEAFKKDQTSKLPIAVFENAGKIHFYREIFNYVSNNNLPDIFSDDELKRLSGCKRNLIGLLYEEYLSKEQLSITNWETIQKIFESFLH